MLFVYIGPINEAIKSYEIHIYDASQDLFPVADQIEAENILTIVDFLKKHHDKLDDKEKLTAKIKIEIHDFYELTTPAPVDPSKFISIFDLLDFYGAVLYESSSVANHFEAVKDVGSLSWLDSWGDYKESWWGWNSGWWGGESQPRALLTLLSIKNKTKIDDPINTNLDNCIKVCKERIYEGNSPRHPRCRKTVAS